MDEQLKQALATERVIDITTMGRKSGEPRRIEIWFHHLDGELYITGRPGKRSWYANLLADPRLTFHLKESVQVDIPATAVAIVDETERRDILTRIVQNLGRAANLENWVQNSPLVKITLTAV